MSLKSCWEKTARGRCGSDGWDGVISDISGVPCDEASSFNALDIIDGLGGELVHRVVASAGLQG